MVLWLVLALAQSAAATHPCDSPVNFTDPAFPLSTACCPYLRSYRDLLGAFTACTAWRSKPFRVCENCIAHYNQLVQLQNTIASDDTVHGESTCYVQLLESDYLHVIDKAVKAAMSVWAISKCDACFEDASAEVISNDTILFFQKSEDVFRCFYIDNQEGGNVCTECKAVYNDINRYFKQLALRGDICMDIAERMNVTRVTWSVSFNCLVEFEDKATVWVLCSLLLALPIAFYVATAVLETKPVFEVFHNFSEMLGLTDSQEARKDEYELIPGVDAADDVTREQSENSRRRDQLLTTSNSHFAVN